MKRITSVLGAAVLVLWCSACSLPTSPTSETFSASGFGPPAASTDDPVPDPDAHFFFLPPLAPKPEYTGTFAPDLEPVVRVSLVEGAEPQAIVEFTTSGRASERVRIEQSEELGDFYIVNFHLKRFDIPPYSELLIEVIVGDVSLGELHAITVPNGSEGDDEATDGRIPLVANRTVPIKFRIEEEYFERIDAGRIDAWLSESAPDSLLAVPEYDDFIAVAAGSYHAVGIRADGSLVSWGEDDHGQVSDTPTGTGFIAVDAGLLYSMALHEDGTVVAWGGGLANSPETRPSGGDFSEIAAGYAFALAATPAGEITGWSLDPDIPATFPDGPGYGGIRAGRYAAAALDGDGIPVLFGTSTLGVIEAQIPAGAFTSVDVGEYHAAGILSDGRLVSWGGDPAVNYGMVQDRADGPYTAVAAGARLGAGVRADGSLFCYGSSDTADDVPTDPAGYFAVAVSPLDSVFAIRKVTD